MTLQNSFSMFNFLNFTSMITHLIKAPKLTDTTGNIDLGHIELFRDHEDPFKFYYLNNILLVFSSTE